MQRSHASPTLHPALLSEQCLQPLSRHRRCPEAPCPCPCSLLPCLSPCPCRRLSRPRGPHQRMRSGRSRPCALATPAPASLPPAPPGPAAAALCCCWALPAHAPPPPPPPRPHARQTTGTGTWGQWTRVSRGVSAWRGQHGFAQAAHPRMTQVLHGCEGMRNMEPLPGHACGARYPQAPHTPPSFPSRSCPPTSLKIMHMCPPCPLLGPCRPHHARPHLLDPDTTASLRGCSLLTGEMVGRLWSMRAASRPPARVVARQRANVRT